MIKGPIKRRPHFPRLARNASGAPAVGAAPLCRICGKRHHPPSYNCSCACCHCEKVNLALATLADNELPDGSLPCDHL